MMCKKKEREKFSCSFTIPLINQSTFDTIGIYSKNKGEKKCLKKKN